MLGTTIRLTFSVLPSVGSYGYYVKTLFRQDNSIQYLIFDGDN